MACPSKKTTIIIRVEGLNWEAFKEAGRWNSVADCVSDGDAAHDSSATVVEVTKSIEKNVPQAPNFADVK
jgi:hypothetical protein